MMISCIESMLLFSSVYLSIGVLTGTLIINHISHILPPYRFSKNGQKLASFIAITTGCLWRDLSDLGVGKTQR